MSTTKHLAGMAVAIVAIMPLAVLGPPPLSPDGSTEPSSEAWPSTNDPSLAEAAETWDFTGFNGSFVEQGDGIHWASLAFPLNKSVEFDLRVTVSWTRQQPDEPKDGAQWWLCVFHGPRAYGEDGLSSGSACFWTGDNDADGVWEVTVEHDGD